MFEGTKKAVTTKTGPNDASRQVVWAISTCFFFFLIFMFMYANYFLLLYLGTKKVRFRKDNKNGPKRRVKTRRLGHMYVFFYLFHV